MKLIALTFVFLTSLTQVFAQETEIKYVKARELFECPPGDFCRSFPIEGQGPRGKIEIWRFTVDFKGDAVQVKLGTVCEVQFKEPMTLEKLKDMPKTILFDRFTFISNANNSLDFSNQISDFTVHISEGPVKAVQCRFSRLMHAVTGYKLDTVNILTEEFEPGAELYFESK